MTYEQLKAQAETMGFKFETQRWVPDGYIEDEDGNDTRRLITKEVSAIKVTFPPDYSRPPDWIYDDDEAGKIKSLQYAIDEYNNKEAIFAENIRKSKETEQAMQAFKTKFGGQGSPPSSGEA